MGMSQEELREWEESGYLVNDPQNHSHTKPKDCWEYAVDQISKDIPGWNLNKTQYSLVKNQGRLPENKYALMEQADKNTGVSRLSLGISKNQDIQVMKEELSKVFSVLSLNQDEDFIKNFQMTLKMHSKNDGHIHAIDLPALQQGKQNYDPQFAFKNLKKMEEAFSKYENLVLDVRTKLDFNNNETFKKLNKLLEVLPLSTNGILIKDNYKPT